MTTEETTNAPVNQAQPTQQPIDAAKAPKFPYIDSVMRMTEYQYYTNLFMGDHFTAFNVKIGDEKFTKEYKKLRYVKANFAGLISKILADMLFSEPVKVTVPEGDQDFMNALWYENNMDVQCYESALSNSALGDAVFKIRSGPREPGQAENTVIIEDITPTIYFPEVDSFNVRSTPERQILAWTFKRNGKKYLRKEVHIPGYIYNYCYEMLEDKIMNLVPLATTGLTDLQPIEQTGINKSLIVHIPNWKTGNRYFGISDYYDLDSIFFAINNRMTSIDNILDKHSDPILMVPPGVIDEHGNVNKKALGVMEVEQGEGEPKYIVWDASLENAFKETEKLMEFMYLTAEISPDILGLGQGVTDSGRALKFKLMRTIAKAQRKKLYYDRGLKEVLYIAQLFAKANNIKVAGLDLKKAPVVPDIDWKDGLPIDNKEQLENETMAVDAGFTSKKAAIMRIYGIDEDSAEKMLEDIKEEGAIDMPKTGFGSGNPFDNKGTGDNTMTPEEMAKQKAEEDAKLKKS